MAGEPVTDELARELRAAWFCYLDAIEPLRPGLHRFCLRLTGSVWDAEDLVQDTLLRGFGAIGRGDLHGERSRVANPRAYLLRTASNLWIDGLRRAQREPLVEGATRDEAVEAAPAGAAREAGRALFEHASPQQRAAIVLKDAFDFTLDEIAELLSTSVGAVKSALHRGRARLKQAAPRATPAENAPSRALVDRFVEAFNARDASRVTSILLETVSIEVQGVGGGRGRDGVWVTSSLQGEGIRAEAREYRGEWVVVNLRATGSAVELYGLTRFEEVDGRIARVKSYGYCPDTLAHVAAELGYPIGARRYRQPSEILQRMIATTALPWLPARD
jgi:RNA polymerase sigma-70 factor (ECF subfamily)